MIGVSQESVPWEPKRPIARFTERRRRRRKEGNASNPSVDRKKDSNQTKNNSTF